MALIKCGECGSQVSTKAKACPSCGARVKRSSRFLRLIGYAVVTFLVLFAIARCNDRYTETRKETSAARAEAKATSDAEEKARDEQKACRSEVTAFVASQEFVTDRLKSPTTANFPYLGTNGVKAEFVGDCTHKITAFVDSQNGFGATVRSSYYVKLKLNPKTDKWHLLEIKMGK